MAFTIIRGFATMSSRPPLPRPALQSPLHTTAQSVLVTASLLLMLTWIGAWVFELRQPLVLAATLAIVLLGLLAIGMRMVRPEGVRRPMPAPGHVPTDFQADAVAARDDSVALRGKGWSLDVFAHIDARRFAAVCETWFAWAGFDTRHETHRTADGVDIWLHAARLPGPVAIVRCRHALDRPVGLQELREFQGVVSSCPQAHGTFTTTSTYTPEALQFARENGIEVVDGRGLLRRILTRTRQSQQALLAVAYHGH